MVKAAAAICVLLWAMVLHGQQLQVLSARDSLRVPFAYLLIKSETVSYNCTASVDGVVDLTPPLTDTGNCTVLVQAFGFKKYTYTCTATQIRQLQHIYLEPANVNLDEVVVTSQYSPTPAERSVQQVKILGRDKIQQMGAVSLRDVLTNQLNIRITQDNILGSGLSLQGIRGENIKILVDGVPVIGRLDGNIDVSQINMNNVERIELVEGPLSVQYGTNALAGTLNIITKKNTTQRWLGGLSAHYESVGTYNLTADAGVAWKKHDLQLSGGRNYFDGWNPGDRPFYFPAARVADSLRVKQWKAKEQYFASVAYQYRAKAFEVGLKTAWFNEVIYNRGYPRAPYGLGAFDDYYYTTRRDNSVSLQARLSTAWSLNLLSAHNFYRRVKRSLYRDLTTLKDTLSGNSADHDTSSFVLWMSRASFVYAPAKAKWSAELGYDANHESALGKRIDPVRNTMGDYALFMTAEYTPWARLVLKPGLRYAYNTAYATPVVPSFNALWMWKHAHSLRVSYARGFRAPTIKELYFQFVDVNHNILGNERLRAERSDNYSLHYTYQQRIRGCRLKTTLSGFYNHITDLISLAQVQAAEYSYINVGRFKSLGMQAEQSLNFLRFFLQVGVNCTGRYNQLSESSELPRFVYSPEVLVNASYRFDKPQVKVALFYKFTGRLPGYAYNGSDIARTSVSAYSLMDLTLSKSFWNGRLQCVAGCKNVLDVTSVVSTLASAGAHSGGGGTMPLATGRNYFLKLNMNF